jgi:hypothetical protein
MERSNEISKDKSKNKSWSEFRAVKNSRLPGRKELFKLVIKLPGDMEIKELSNILPVQDMPYLPDGTPLDLVLNPLGVST